MISGDPGQPFMAATIVGAEYFDVSDQVFVLGHEFLLHLRSEQHHLDQSLFMEFLK